MMEQHKSWLSTTITGALILIVIFLAGIQVGKNKDNQITKQVEADIFSKTSTPDNINIFWDVWDLMNSKFLFDKPSDEERVYGAIQGLVASHGDPYTVYFPPKAAEQFEQDVINSQFGGIGVEIDNIHGLLTVVSPLKDTPAYRAGLAPKDIITKVDDIDITEMPMNKAIEYIRGKPGTEVILTVAREGEELIIPITRENIQIPIINSYVSGDTQIIELYSFSEKSTTLLEQELTSMVNNNISKLVLDLRGNPGGLLDQAVVISSLFLNEGDVITIERNAKGKDIMSYKALPRKIVPDETKIAVLVNKGSASASEILAGALQFHNRATIIGTQTFGKGSVQELVNLPDGSALKVSIAEWLTPGKESIHEVGLTPDITLEEPEEDSNDPYESVYGLNNSQTIDFFTEKAIEYLRSPQ